MESGKLRSIFVIQCGQLLHDRCFQLIHFPLFHGTCIPQFVCTFPAFAHFHFPLSILILSRALPPSIHYFKKNGRKNDSCFFARTLTFNFPFSTFHLSAFFRFSVCYSLIKLTVCATPGMLSPCWEHVVFISAPVAVKRTRRSAPSVIRRYR